MEKRVYITGERIGDEGGFGEVYSAQRKINDTIVPGVFALKKLIVEDNESIKRFQKETRLLSKLNHPRIIKVEDFKLQEEPYFYVMPMYRGSLKKFLPEVIGHFERIKTIFNNIFDGVEYLHEQGVYHRDLKPANILINSDNDLVISDFGLQLNINAETTRLTQTGRMGMGTILYMAPEQFQDSKYVDYRADIYSLGRMICESFVGILDKPFYLDLTQVDSTIKYVIERYCSANPDDRFGSIAELRQFFNLSMDILIHGTYVTDLDSIMAEMHSINDINPETIDKLSRAIIGTRMNPDSIHELMMKMNDNAFALLVTRHSSLSQEIISTFVNHITAQGWPFSYTDDIAVQCRRLYSAIAEYQIRANLLYAILEVGVSHNRWFVMNVFRELIVKVSDTQESFIIIDLLKDKPYLTKEIGVSKNKLNHILQQLID